LDNFFLHEIDARMHNVMKLEFLWWVDTSKEQWWIL
jgi:hypothetical protein